MSKFDEEHIKSLLEALSKIEDISDANELRIKLQNTYNQIGILQQKQKTFINEIQQLRRKVTELNKERVQLKKHVFEITFQRDLNEHNLKSTQNSLKSLQNELKLKNSLLVKIESEKRKIEIQFRRLKNNYLSNNSNINNLSKSTSEINLTNDKINDKDIKKEKIVENSKKLLNNGLVRAYSSSKLPQDVDKTLVLQKLLLGKVKEIAEKNVLIEELEKKYNDLFQQISKIKQTKYLAEELTNTRHKLNVKTKQLQGLKIELKCYKEKLTNYMVENQELKQKLYNISKKQHKLKI